MATDLRTLTRIWRGELTWAEPVRSGALEVSGPRYVERNLARWLHKSAILPAANPAPASEDLLPAPR